MKNFFAILSIILLAGCANDEPAALPDVGYDYFPVAIGTFVEYRADSIYHDQPDVNIPGVHDTTSYFIREVIESEFKDAANESSLRLERYKRNTESEPWTLIDVWFQKRTASNAQKVEENTRYIKLAFPVRAGSTWDGNALNVLDTWQYIIDSVNVSRNYGSLSFDQTATVVQRVNKNFVEDELAYEIFAPGAGLIYRYHRDLDTRFEYIDNPVAQNIRLGIEFKWEIIAYGVE
jgi:hypothetical protein